MQKISGFYTLKGYSLLENGKISSAMEDYIEMITRMVLNMQTVKVSSLSELLHVKASSVTKMIQQLSNDGYVEAKKYSEITLTEKGLKAGKYFIYRHNVLHTFLCLVNKTDNELEQTEKIEHFIDERTVKNIELIINQLKKG